MGSPQVSEVLVIAMLCLFGGMLLVGTAGFFFVLFRTMTRLTATVEGLAELAKLEEYVHKAGLAVAVVADKLPAMMDGMKALNHTFAVFNRAAINPAAASAIGEEGDSRFFGYSETRAAAVEEEAEHRRTGVVTGEEQMLEKMREELRQATEEARRQASVARAIVQQAGKLAAKPDGEGQAAPLEIPAPEKARQETPKKQEPAFDIVLPASAAADKTESHGTKEPAFHG